MARNNCRVYCCLHYGLDITYEDLQTVEAELTATLQDRITELGGVHLDFWGYGDSLQIEFAFPRFDDDQVEGFAHALAELLPEDVHARVIALDRGLERAALYGVTAGQALGGLADPFAAPLESFRPAGAPGLPRSQ